MRRHDLERFGAAKSRGKRESVRRGPRSKRILSVVVDLTLLVRGHGERCRGHRRHERNRSVATATVSSDTASQGQLLAD